MHPKLISFTLILCVANLHGFLMNPFLYFYGIYQLSFIGTSAIFCCDKELCAYVYDNPSISTICVVCFNDTTMSMVKI